MRRARDTSTVVGRRKGIRLTRCTAREGRCLRRVFAISALLASLRPIDAFIGSGGARLTRLAIWPRKPDITLAIHLKTTASKGDRVGRAGDASASVVYRVGVGFTFFAVVARVGRRDARELAGAADETSGAPVDSFEGAGLACQARRAPEIAWNAQTICHVAGSFARAGLRRAFRTLDGSRLTVVLAPGAQRASVSRNRGLVAAGQACSAFVQPH